MLHSPSRKRFFSVLLMLTLLFSIVVPVAANGGNGQGGFRALRGEEAAAFRVPDDMRLVRHDDLSGYGVQAERYQQYFNGAKVFGGQISVYKNSSGTAFAVVGSHYPALAASNAVKLNDGQAKSAAAKQPEAVGQLFSELMINPSNGRYFYVVESRALDSRWFFWVDAESGEFLNSYDGFADGTGIGVLGDTKDLTGLTRFSGGVYQMISSDGRQITYDAGNRNRLPGTLATDADDNWNLLGSTSPAQQAMVDAQFYARVTDNYYLGTYNFNWMVHYPQGMISSVHVQRNYNNAGWNGTQMVYGDGDGTTFINFSGDLDVVGHELSHGVTEATSNLIYQNESGALNEAFSDIMGTAIEYYYGTGNWTIGEDITPGTNGIRNMANPGEDGDPSYYADRYTGTGDNGGVHINSGIANHWFYLLVNGGQNANPARASGTNVVGIGLAAAENIAFLGFTALPASANFCAARASTIAVAGSQAANVADAWDEVGVDQALCGGGGGGGNGPTITNVASKKLKGGKFQITWTTNVPSDSAVIFTCCGTYTNSSLVTSHSMQFNGSIGAAYEYYVRSTDANGNSSTAGPFIHQN
jgi:Zn-dependent metalloprotease